jgi:ribonuclease BN (tRNA processing enzyme)
LGWGHSSIDQAIELAVIANIKTLALYSHAPERTDSALDKVLAQFKFDHLQVIAAQEGKTHEI